MIIMMDPFQDCVSQWCCLQHAVIIRRSEIGLTTCRCSIDQAAAIPPPPPDYSGSGNPDEYTFNPANGEQTFQQVL